LHGVSQTRNNATTAAFPAKPLSSRENRKQAFAVTERPYALPLASLEQPDDLSPIPVQLPLIGGARMSRAINVSVAPDVVQALCTRHKVSISTLEALPAGGSRVVLVTTDGADVVRLKMKDKILSGTVVRSGQFHARAPMAPHR
jgi:hypothetical protein